MSNNKGSFIVDSNGIITVDYLYDGGWFGGEVGVFSLAAMDDYEPGSTTFIKEAARRASSNSEIGHVLIQDQTEGAKFSAELPWERNFNAGTYPGIKTFNLTPGDEVGLMLVQNNTIASTFQKPQKTDKFGKAVIFSLPEANSFNSGTDGSEIVDVNGSGAIAWEDVPLSQADKDYNDLIIDIQGLEGSLPTLADSINPTRDWREYMVLWDGELNVLSDDDLVMHLELDELKRRKAADSSPEGKNNQGKLKKGAKFHDGVVEFDGKNDFIEVQDSSDINTSTHAKRTISVWFKVDDKDLDKPQIIYEEGGFLQEDGGLNIYIDNGQIYFGGWNRSGGNWSGTYLSSDDLTSNTWHHAVLVLDAEWGVDTLQEDVFTAYLDGVKIGSGKGMELTPHSDDIGIGGLNKTTIFHDEAGSKKQKFSLAGSIDDVRLYNHSLTASEIAFLYNPNHDPTALDDEVLTTVNTEVTFLADNLLNNDSDRDRNSLTLTSVDGAINGTVTLNESGNVIFIPDNNFTGDASFTYTVNDEHGGSDTATATVTVLPGGEPIPLGTNLHRLADWSPQFPFINAFKSARQWIPQDWGVTPREEEAGFQFIWDTGEFDQLDLDEQGWVKSLPAPEDEESEYSSVTTLMFRNVGDYPGGKYVVLYEGEGEIEYELDAVKDEEASTLGRDVIEVTPSSAGILLRITQTDPQETGEYIRDLKVIPEKYEYAHDQIFNPEFLEKIQPFNTLRFMDWMATNHSTQGEWSNRPTPDSSIFSGEIASVEAMVELANRTDTDPWFTMPHMATDEYITNFAQYVKDNLDPELKVYVEYSNEVWNNDFGQGWWIEEQGKEEFAESTVGDFGKRMDWFGKRTTEITQMWDEVFAEDKERVVGVLGAQAANHWTARRPLAYEWTENPLSHEEYGIDAIAIAPYFGSYIGKPEYEEEIEAWIDSENEDSENLALDNLFKEITEGGGLSYGTPEGALQQAYTWTEGYAAIADLHGLDLLTYESGQHLNGTGGVEENDAIGDLFIAANRDPRMGEIYQEYFATLHDLGVDLSLNYTDVSRYNKYGSWGLLENVTQTDSPKYNAIINTTTKVTHELPPEMGKLNTNLSDLNILLAGEELTVSTNYTDVGLTDYHKIEFDWDDDGAIEVVKQDPLLGDVGRIAGGHTYHFPGIYRPTITVTDDDNMATSKTLTVAIAEKLAIDWEQNNNSAIDLTGSGRIKVSILGSSDFDPATIDPTTIRADDEPDVLLDGQDVSAIPIRSSLQDTNNDGWQDLEITFQKSTLRGVIDMNAEPFLSNNQIYLFGTSTALEGGFFLGMEN